MPGRTQVGARINGEQIDFLCDPWQSLLEVLRDELSLTGAKEGCNNGNCGACNIVLNGALVNSCCVLAAEVDGGEIVTIEGVADGDRLDPRDRPPPVRHLHAGLHRRREGAPRSRA